MYEDAWIKAVNIQMDAMHRRHEDMQAQLEALNKQLSDIRREVSELKKSTEELVDILQSWKGAMKVLTFFGALAKPVGYIATAAAAVWGIFHFGDKT